jgi:phosphotransferase system enzyme I (PtsP)
MEEVRKVIMDARHRGEMSVRPAVMKWLAEQG